MFSPDQERDHVERASRGGQAELTTLLEVAGSSLHAELEARIGEKYRGLVDADDVLQVTFLEAFLRFRSFVWSGPNSFNAWLRRIAENNLRDAIRELERDKRPPPGKRLRGSDESHVALLERIAATSTTASKGLSREESKRALETALDQLPKDYERVVRLYELEELSGVEVAERMGRSHGAVRMLLSRALARLKELLGSESRFF